MSTRSKMSPPDALCLTYPMPSRYHSGAQSPTLTPITGSSTYSMEQTDTSLTPFDKSHDSAFELEFKLVEYRGDYIFSADHPFDMAPSSLQDTPSWSSDTSCPRTPDFGHSPREHGRGHDGSECSFESEGPYTQPCTPSTGCDSPTIPGDNFLYQFSSVSSMPNLSSWDESETPDSHVTPVKKQVSDRQGSLLSPITIVLDTIQEHAILDVPASMTCRRPRVSRRQKELPEIRALPAINLFDSCLLTTTTTTILSPGTASPAPSMPLPAIPEDVFISHALPVTDRKPWHRPPRSESQLKLERVLGRGAEVDDHASFDMMPFQYAQKPVPSTRLYDMF